MSMTCAHDRYATYPEFPSEHRLHTYSNIKAVLLQDVIKHIRWSDINRACCHCHSAFYNVNINFMCHQLLAMFMLCKTRVLKKGIVVAARGDSARLSPLMHITFNPRGTNNVRKQVCEQRCSCVSHPEQFSLEQLSSEEIVPIKYSLQYGLWIIQQNENIFWESQSLMADICPIAQPSKKQNYRQTTR